MTNGEQLSQTQGDKISPKDVIIHYWCIWQQYIWVHMIIHQQHMHFHMEQIIINTFIEIIIEEIIKSKYHKHKVIK